MDLLANSNIWLIFSFTIFLLILWRFAKDAVINALDQKIEDIKNELAEAENLRTEAQEMLAQYQRKHKDAVKDAENILKEAKEHAQKLTEEADNRLKQSMERKEKQLKDRIENMEKAAFQELQSYAANLAVQATREIITDQISKKLSSELADQSIDNVKKSVH